MFEQIETDALLNCETNPYFSESEKVEVIVYIDFANSFASFQTSNFSKE
jgi:hypothetical protein